MSSRFPRIPRAPQHDDRVSFGDDTEVLGLDWLTDYLSAEDLDGADVEATRAWLELTAEHDPTVGPEWELDEDAVPSMLLVLAQMRLADVFLGTVSDLLGKVDLIALSHAA